MKKYWIRKVYRNKGAIDTGEFTERDEACRAAIQIAKTEPELSFCYTMTEDSFGEVFVHIYRPSEYLND